MTKYWGMRGGERHQPNLNFSLSLSQMVYEERIFYPIVNQLYIKTVKKGGRNHSLFILNGMQTNTPSIGPHQNLSNEITLEYWRIDPQLRLP